MKDYKKILEGVVDIINTTEKSDIGFANICTYIGENCLELKESEDERFKNFISNELVCLRAINGKGSDRYEELTKAINWLEKQGEHANFRNKIQVGDKVTRNEDGVLVNLSQLNRVAKKDEKKGEQKPVDKVEPKFRKGDWVVYCNDDVDLITGVEENGYCINNSGYIPFICESDVRLWTIQDAKDGDVLCTYECGKPKIVFILEGAPKKPYVLGYHCFYNIMYPHFEFDSEKGCLAPNEEDVKPATKEQRDLLFQKMHEAGYEWDADKKELKKIEQKPAWSEEDEKQARQIERIVHDDGCTQKLQKQIADWLKSLKDRYTWKPSDEQMDALEAAISSLQSTALETLYKQLKQL